MLLLLLLFYYIKLHWEAKTKIHKKTYQNSRYEQLNLVGKG